MAFQKLDGISITHRGSYFASRFGAQWATSSAFNGYIYSASVDIGFSNQPSTIKISCILDAGSKSQNLATFNIQPNDLRCDAGFGGDLNTFEINFNGINFIDFILYDYEISIEANNKILSVTFKDYSVILDKIYIGLIKRQGNKFTHSATSHVQFPVLCPDCVLAGDSFVSTGDTTRDIVFGSYVGINGQVYDNFDGLTTSTNVFHNWDALFNSPKSNVNFDLNGGYLMIGTEEVTEERCGNLGGIFYNFNQLLASLRFRGFKFEGAFPHAALDFDFIYKQNYIGTLREVLQQWCADLGYDFYCNARTFVGINIGQAFDIQKIVQIADPTTELGANFALNQNSAILSYKESVTLANSYRQGVITANTRPRQTKIHSKSPKRYIGLAPLHPIDFNLPSHTIITRKDVFNNGFKDSAWLNSFVPGADDLSRTLPKLDNRTFKDIDTAIALTHYNSDLRDIFCQDQAIYGATVNDRNAHFKALGLVPLLEITDPNEKSIAIRAIYPGADEEVTNICLDSRFYKVYLGYSYPQAKADIVNWEQAAASSMYKYGAILKGLYWGEPYVPSDVITNLSPTAGLYGDLGVSALRIKHSYEPSAKQYYDLYAAPFKDIILYNNFKRRDDYNSSSLDITIVPGQVKDDYLPGDIYIAELSNDWGTTQDSFNRNLSLSLNDACVQEYSQEPSYTNVANGFVNKFQDWKLNLFTPQTYHNMDDLFSNFEGEFAKLSGVGIVDRTVKTYYDTNYNVSNTCSKIHLIVLTDTRSHPNIAVNFTRKEDPEKYKKHREKSNKNTCKIFRTRKRGYQAPCFY